MTSFAAMSSSGLVYVQYTTITGTGDNFFDFIQRCIVLSLKIQAYYYYFYPPIVQTLIQ